MYKSAVGDCSAHFNTIVNDMENETCFQCTIELLEERIVFHLA